MSVRPAARRVVAGRAGPLAALCCALLASAAAPALAAFTGDVLAQAGFAAYTVPAPAQVGCSGLGLLRGQIVWDAVAPPSGATVSYEVTQPDGVVVATTATAYALPLITLVGDYVVRTRLSAGGWSSAGVAITVTNVGGVYLCG